MTSSFAGEAFLETPIPDVDTERFWLVLSLSFLFIALVVVAPVVLGKLYPAKGDEVPVAVKWLPRMNFMGLVLTAFCISRTSNNLFSARSVFVAPLFTNDECLFVIECGHDAAQRNLELHPNITELQMSPPGWRKKRHGSYPTTDLNLVSDPFTKEDRQYVAQRLQSRLAPLIYRIYGMVPASIRANDMFLVRYDAHEGQQALKPHTDEAHVSFNVLLNDDFEGGGTRFHNRKADEYFDVHPPKGHVLLSNAVMRHEGLPTTRGTRYILVGFLSIDKERPRTGVGTGLSCFASWLSMPWAQVRFKQGYKAIALRQSGQNKWTDSGLLYYWYTGMANLLEFLGDWTPHKSYSLVDAENVTQYLSAMDAVQQSLFDRASWFQGQQLVTDVDGKIVEQWKTRQSDPREL